MYVWHLAANYTHIHSHRVTAESTIIHLIWNKTFLCPPACRYFPRLGSGVFHAGMFFNSGTWRGAFAHFAHKFKTQAVTLARFGTVYNGYCPEFSSSDLRFPEILKCQPEVDLFTTHGFLPDVDFFNTCAFLHLSGPRMLWITKHKVDSEDMNSTPRHSS